MTVIKFAWYPFNTKGHTQQQTYSHIRRGLDVLSNLANVRFVYSSQPEFTISGYPSGKWAAATYQNHIWFDTTRKISADWWTFNAMPHEFCHLWGNPKFCAWGHAASTSYNCLMHPNASRQKFMCPNEAKRFIQKYGPLGRQYWPLPPLKKIGDRIRQNKPLMDKWESERIKWATKRDSTVGPMHQEYNEKAKAAHKQFLKYWTLWLDAVREYKSMYKRWLPVLRMMEGLSALNYTRAEYGVPPTPEDSNPIVCWMDDSPYYASTLDMEHDEHQRIIQLKHSLNPEDLRPCEFE